MQARKPARSTCQGPHQAENELALRRIEQPLGLLRAAPGDTVDFRELLSAPVPDHREEPRTEPSRIEVCLYRPSEHSLPRLQPNAAEVEPVTVRSRPAGLLLKFSSGSILGILAREDFAFDDRPMPGILPGPQGSSRMGDQHFERLFSSVGHETCADSHPPTISRAAVQYTGPSS